MAKGKKKAQPPWLPALEGLGVSGVVVVVSSGLLVSGLLVSVVVEPPRTPVNICTQ